MGTGASVSFDRAADFYDATRVTDAASLDRIIALVRSHLGEGPLLEIGVGTGQLTVPLAGTGADVTGIDLSAPMLERLRAKDPSGRVRLVRGDATGLPFGNGSFAGAYCRWVLHLIPAWREALRELDRVVGPAGAIAVEPGGMSGVFGELFRRFVEILGDVALPPGLDPVDREAALDDGMRTLGWALADVVAVVYEREVALETWFEEIPAKEASWTWPVPDAVLRDAVVRVREEAAVRYGDLSRPVPAVATRWRVYRRAM
jgi:SAM-dependent methyltransferase